MSVTTTPEVETGKNTADQADRRVGGGLLDPKILWKSTPDAFK